MIAATMSPAATDDRPRPHDAHHAHDAGREGDPLAEVARAAVAGDPAAVQTLLATLAPAMLRAVRALLGHDHADVEDVLQNALVALLPALAGFRGECLVRQYAVRIAVRQASGKRRRIRQVGSWLDAFRRREEPVAPVAAPPPDATLTEVHRALLRDLLARLPEAQSEALALQVGLGYTVEEIAEATAVPLFTARTRLRLAKAALRKGIEADPRLADLREDGP